MRKFLGLFLVTFFLAGISNVSAQVNDVCLVYFTGDACGDECRLTDSFVDGLIGEYSENLVAIKYNIDTSQENKAIFEAYRRAYNLPSGVPLVLFGENDYLLGRSAVYRNAESKIYGFIRTNGTNCPLESGYVPPGEVNSDMLPGDPEFYESGEAPEEGGEGETSSETEGGNKTTETTTPIDLGDIQRIYEEDPILIFIVVAVLILIFLIFLIKRR
ncbi:MAG: hypothetical protein GTN38_00015 [Candidatus Aenigmarchaeota archaeon]|nr:hypothetical protein [Candidatus Aenigmarchaeota archaeon]NIP39889.1 hypothetical protein [Candidatus Aenigmarchaeota archaeon]NIQ17608.1 hypothetical protein [Candidatus Aenigmarchaeota archaeon]NIS72796.1 hypothetical protein [Candidatus Aenigmarchaeota archaeon]